MTPSLCRKRALSAFWQALLMRLFLFSLLTVPLLPAKPKGGSKVKPGNEDNMWVVALLLDLPAGVSHHTYRSAAMNREVGFCLYLPPSYATSADRRYPVRYHLHGAGGNETRTLHNAEVLHEGILAGRWPEIIMVFPNGGRATLYRDSGDGRFLAETTFIQELIPYLDAH